MNECWIYSQIYENKINKKTFNPLRNLIMQKEIGEWLKSFIKKYGLKSVKEFTDLPRDQYKIIIQEYMREKNIRRFPVGWSNQKLLQQIVDEMPTIE